MICRPGDGLRISPGHVLEQRSEDEGLADRGHRLSGLSLQGSMGNGPKIRLALSSKGDESTLGLHVEQDATEGGIADVLGPGGEGLFPR
jgi:hypothetical protein